MHYDLTITAAGRTNTTSGVHAADMTLVAGIIAGLGSKSPDAEFTIAAASGPDFTAAYGDITDVRLEWSR